MVYTLVCFSSWIIYWTFYGKYIDASKIDAMLCSDANIYINKNTVHTVSYCISSLFFTAFLIQFISLFNFASTGIDSYRRVPIYCSALIHLIAFLTHFFMAVEWFPMSVSSFGRINYIPRWGEWISLIPLLMIMVNSIYVKSKSDETYLIQSTGMQVLSILFALIASFAENYVFAVVMIALSTIVFLHIYYDVYRALKTYQETADLENSTILLFASVDKNVDDSNTATIIEIIDHNNLLMYVNLTIICCVTWSIFVLIFGLAAAFLIDHTTEFILFSLIEIVSKFLYTRVAYTSHAFSLNTENILSKMLFLEEKAQATIRNFLRFILHEVSTPLNNISMTLDTLFEIFYQTQSLSENKDVNNQTTDSSEIEDAEEALVVAKDSCQRIKNSFRDLISYQVRLLVEILFIKFF